MARGGFGRWWTGTFAVLGEANFRRYFVGQTISGLGDSLVPVALTFAVLDQTHSATDLSIVLVSQALAQILLVIAGGVIADRLGRRTVMLWSDTAQMVGIGVLGALFVTGRPSIPVIAVVGVVQGAAGAVFMPASSGILPALVDGEVLQEANNLEQIAGAATSIAGPALAGVLVVTVGAGWGLVADALTYVASVWSLARLDPERAPRPERSRWASELREGWTAFRSRTWVWAITLGATGFNLAYAAYMVIGPLTVARSYDGAATWATINAVSGVGAIIGGLGLSRVRPRHPFRLAMPAVAGFALAPLALALHAPVVAVAVLAAFGGFGLLVFSGLYRTAIGRHLPAEVISRVSAWDWLGSLAAYPLGLAVAAPVAAAIGTGPALGLVVALVAGPTLGLLLVPSVVGLTMEPSSELDVPVGERHPGDAVAGVDVHATGGEAESGGHPL